MNKKTLGFDSSRYLALVLFFVLSQLLATGLATADDSNNDLSHLLEPESVLTLTLAEAVVRTLDHNLDITVSKHERDVRVTDILFEQAKFDPTVIFRNRRYGFSGFFCTGCLVDFFLADIDTVADSRLHTPPNCCQQDGNRQQSRAEF